MNIFELFDKELECDMAYVESELANAKYAMLADPETFMEAGNDGNIFQKLLAKIKEIVEKGSPQSNSSSLLSKWKVI